MRFIEEAKRVLDIEAQSILEVKAKLNHQFEDAVQMIHSCKGKVIVSGIGKSGHIARKVAGTFSSTGTPSFFLHLAESSHGDLGVIGAEDVIIIISFGGNSEELKDLIAHTQRKAFSYIAITGNTKSMLAQSAKYLLDVGISVEACPLGLAPTSSSTATLAMGDALAMAVLLAKGFRKEDFAEFHPGGSLGRRLLTRVSDVMHGQEAIPLVKMQDTVKDILPVMTAKEVRGAVGVTNENDELVGIITDGDIRRHLNTDRDHLKTLAKEIMSLNPKTILANEMAEKALFVMEQFSIQLLFVMKFENDRKPIGILHLQDLLKAKIR